MTQVLTISGGAECSGLLVELAMLTLISIRTSMYLLRDHFEKEVLASGQGCGPAHLLSYLGNQ